MWLTRMETIADWAIIIGLSLITAALAAVLAFVAVMFLIYPFALGDVGGIFAWYIAPPIAGVSTFLFTLKKLRSAMAK